MPIKWAEPRPEPPPIYTVNDLSEDEQHALLSMTYGEFRREYGGMANGLERDMCAAYQCRGRDLDAMAMESLFQAERHIAGGGAGAWCERYACRWIVQRRGLTKEQWGKKHEGH